MTEHLNTEFERLTVFDGPGDTAIRPADPEKVRQILEKYGGMETWEFPDPTPTEKDGI